MVSRPYYLLHEAFEALGQRLYGSEWTGNEFTAVRIETVDEAKAELARLQEIDERTTARLDELKTESLKTTNAERLKAIESTKDALHAERKKIHPNFWTPGWRERRIADARTYERRSTTERTLLEAIKASKFPVVARHGNAQRDLDPWLWRDRFFAYDLEISAVRVPRVWGKRFQSARIPDAQFEAWLVTAPVLTAAAERELPRDARLQALFQSWGERQQKPKANYYREAFALIPDLSRRAFDEAWSKFARGDFKDLGRRRWPKK